MKPSSRYLAFLAYLLSLPGALILLLLRRRDPFVFYHARQSLVLSLAALVAPLIWAALAWALAWIPTVGPLLGISLFSLVIAIFIALAFSWLAGLIYALQGKIRPLPLIGAWITRFDARAAQTAAQEFSNDLIERTSTTDA